MRNYDAIVIGSGPNGLSAAVSIATAGYSVLVIEASQEIGGAARTLPLTLPGFLHDIGSAIHPLAVSSPAFAKMPLAQFGLEWVQPEIPLAHPLEGGRAVALEHSLAATARRLGNDAGAYCRLLQPLVQNWNVPADWARGKFRLPQDPAGLLRLAFASMRSAMGLLDSRFQNTGARALLAGMAAHSGIRLEDAFSAGFALCLGASGHAVGWPFPRGGAGNITRALAEYLRSLGVDLETGVRVNSLGELPAHRIALCDVSPRELLRIAGSRLPEWYRSKLRDFRYGPGVFKLDWALDGPIPWAAAECCRAGTVHIGGTAEEIADSERAVVSGTCADAPFVIAAQHTLFDPSRAPAGKHTGWAYCHLPNGSDVDMTERIEAQIERFAPGFRNRILARSVLGPMALQAHNANLIGGDIYGGANQWQQLFARPTFLLYLTPDPRILICSSSTPPGPGVHGLCGNMAARLAVPRLRKWTARRAGHTPRTSEKKARPSPAPVAEASVTIRAGGRFRRAGMVAAAIAICATIAIFLNRKISRSQATV